MHVIVVLLLYKSISKQGKGWSLVLTDGFAFSLAV